MLDELGHKFKLKFSSLAKINVKWDKKKSDFCFIPCLVENIYYSMTLLHPPFNFDFAIIFVVAQINCSRKIMGQQKVLIFFLRLFLQSI